MALQLDISVIGQKILSANFITVDLGQEELQLTSYVRIDNISGNKNNFTITVGFYESGDLSKYLYAKHYNFQAELDIPDNFIKQAYEYLKTLSEFSTAVDC